MNFLKDIGHDLVEKKLWPFAAILVAMIVAVPMTLAKPGESTIAPTLPAKIAEEAIGPELALTRAATTGFARAPRVNDSRLDPFARRSKAKVEKAASNYSDDASSVIDSGGSSDGSTVPSDPGGGGSTPAPDPTPEVKTEQDDLLSILVTDDDDPTAEPVEVNDIRTLSPLPDTDNPFLVYLGKADDDRASFLVSSDVTVSGDGECSPSPDDCRTLTLGIGQTQHFVLRNDNNKKISITMTDLVTSRVEVTGTAARAARLEHEARVVGAKALKSALVDEEVVKSLMREHVKIRS